MGMLENNTLHTQNGLTVSQLRTHGSASEHGLVIALLGKVA